MCLSIDPAKIKTKWKIPWKKRRKRAGVRERAKENNRNEHAMHESEDEEEEEEDENEIVRVENVPTGDQHIIINDIFYSVNYIINQNIVYHSVFAYIRKYVWCTSVCLRISSHHSLKWYGQRTHQTHLSSSFGFGILIHLNVSLMVLPGRTPQTLWLAVFRSSNILLLSIQQYQKCILKKKVRSK